MSSVNDTLKSLQAYFDSRIKEHGASAKGVDWKDENAQEIRFSQFEYLFRDKQAPFSLLDFGSGYGALANFLTRHGYNFQYVGYDMTPAVIEEAQRVFAGQNNIQFTTHGDALTPVDYTVGSGLFNMKINANEEEWHKHMENTVNRLWELCTKGMAFNSLTSYSDKEYMRADLYYPDPKWWFDYAKRNLSRNVSLVHDYELYDFTLIVRK
jgi:SAM-dependent methyltransferase